MSAQTKAELQAENEALKARLALAEDLLKAVRQVSASPLPDTTVPDLYRSCEQLRDRLEDIAFASDWWIRSGTRLPAARLRRWAAEKPFTFPVNPVWAVKRAGHAPEDFERREAAS